MIDFELTAADREIVDLARAQGDVYRARKRRNDHKVDYRADYRADLRVPGEENFQHLRNLAKRRAAETSGPTILEALIYLEENCAGKPQYYRGLDGDTINLNIAGELLTYVGTAEQQALWGEKFFSWGMSEPVSGSDPASMITTAVFDAAANEWVINGEKVFSSNSTHADGILLMCRIVGPEGPEGIGVIVVEQGTPGYSISPQMEKLGLRNWDTVSTAFMDCRVPARNRLMGNLKDALSIFNGTRALIAAQALGISRVAMDAVREAFVKLGIELVYGADCRQASGLADRFLRLEALWDAAYLSILHAKWHEQRHGPAPFYPAVAKLKSGVAVRRLIRECMEILGPMAASVQFPVEQAFRDSRIMDIYEGPSEVQRLIIGRALLQYSGRQLN